MYCPQCNYCISTLPDVHSCPECGFIYIAKITTIDAPPRHWGYTVIVCALVGLPACVMASAPLISAIHYLLERPIRPLFLSSLDSPDPLCDSFEAWVVVVFATVLAIAGITRIGRSPSFRLMDGTVCWKVRRSIEQRIPFYIISSVHLSKDGLDVLLGLTIGRKVCIPQKSYSRLYTAIEVYELLTRAVSRSKPKSFNGGE